MSFRHCEKWRLVKKLVHKKIEFKFSWSSNNYRHDAHSTEMDRQRPNFTKESAIVRDSYQHLRNCEKFKSAFLSPFDYLIHFYWHYSQLIAHVIMFVMLLGLINAEKAQKLLMEDIDDQKEMEDYYYYPAVNNKGETLDIVRLNSATKLAASTILKLTIGTAIATVYLLVCLGLFAGVIKNRSHFIIPWMIFDVVISLVINSVLVIIGTNMLYERFAISEWMYCE